jgi:hypothetical protein
MVGIGVLVAVALILFFIRQEQVSYGVDGTPEGVTRNYLLALQRNDYERAYSYLAEGINKPDLSGFRQPFLTYQSAEVANASVEVGVTSPDLQGDSALVQVTILRGGGDLFSDVYRDRQVVNLVRQNGAWKIRLAPYPFWDYQWDLQPMPTVTPAS